MAHGSHPIHQQDINAGIQLELLQSVRTNDTHLLSDWRASVSGQDAVVSQPFVSSMVCKLPLLGRGELKRTFDLVAGSNYVVFWPASEPDLFVEGRWWPVGLRKAECGRRFFPSRVASVRRAQRIP